MTKKERLILLLLSALNFTHILDFMIMMPLGNYLIPYFSISPQQFAILVSAYTFSAGASGFVAAFYVDNFDRKKILIAAYIGFLVGTLACGLAPTFALLLTARTLTGVFGGLIGAQVISIVSDTFPYERRGQAMGAIMSAFLFDPNAAWIALACDLPLLTEGVVQYLIENRNPSSIATAYRSPENEHGFPEPLIALWEPKSFPELLRFLSQGIMCPRKVLINSDTHLIDALVPEALMNANTLEDKNRALSLLNPSG